MAKKVKKGVLPRIEVIIVLVFFLSFIVWAVSQCNAKKSSYLAEEDLEEQIVDEHNESYPTSSIHSESTRPNTAQRPTSEANSTPGAATQRAGTPPRPVASPQIKTVYATKLFVTVDGLKFRKGPSMDSAVILTLPIYQELEFMNEVSDSTQTISMGNGVMANERWIKVRHWKGHEGWVYGAGVNYFKPPNPISTPSQ